MAIPLILIATAASMIAGQAKKRKELERLHKDASWARQGLTLDAANHATDKLGGDSFNARQIHRSSNLNRDEAQAERDISNQGNDIGSILGLVGQGNSALGGLFGGGDSGGGYQGPSDTPGSGELPTSSYDFSGAGNVAAAPLQFASYGAGAASPLQAPAAAAGSGAVKSVFDEINGKYRRRW